MSVQRGCQAAGDHPEPGCEGASRASECQSSDHCVEGCPGCPPCSVLIPPRLLQILELRDLTCEGIQLQDLQPYVMWSLDWPKNQSGSTQKVKAAPGEARWKFHSHHKIDIEPRNKATQRKFRFLKLQLEVSRSRVLRRRWEDSFRDTSTNADLSLCPSPKVYHARMLWRHKLIGKAEFKMKDLLQRSDLRVQLRLRSGDGSGILDLELKQRRPIAGSMFGVPLVFRLASIFFFSFSILSFDLRI